jgi:hypothetical protein
MPFQPTREQRKIADAFLANARLLGDSSTFDRLGVAAGARFNEPRIGLLVGHTAARQAEFGSAVVSDVMRGRFGPATVLARSMLETTAWIAWPIGHPDDGEQRRRLIRLLLQGYRDSHNQGLTLPDDANELLKATTGKAASKPPSFKDTLEQLDALEAKTPGGVAFWFSHADHYEFASDYTHPTFAASMSADMKPLEWLGVNALARGHQYLALAGGACAIIADVPEIRSEIEARYAEVAHLQTAELARAAKL